MKEDETADFKIVCQGAPIINSARYRYKSNECIVIEIDCTSKYLEINGSSGAMVFIAATDSSLNLNEFHDKDESTDIEFVLPHGDWICVSTGSGRYSIVVTYLKV